MLPCLATLSTEAYAQAEAKLESVASVEMYFADASEWSSSALLDGVWYTRHSSHVTRAFRTVALDPRIGARRFASPAPRRSTPPREK